MLRLVTGVEVTPHMLPHILRQAQDRHFGTQLVNAGADITTIQALLGHSSLNTTMIYARVHDKTVMADYFRAMEEIEGGQTTVFSQNPNAENVCSLLNEMEESGLSDQQQQILAELRRYLA
jgi:integrase/recombinase XerC